MKLNEVMQILDSFPSVGLGVGLTPLQRLYRTEVELDTTPLYIKRDDLNGLSIGGNKVRNLEFILGKAISDGCDAVIVSGKVQSNLCTLTAAACAFLSLDCVIVHNDEPPDVLLGNAILNSIFAPDIHYIGDVDLDNRNAYVKSFSDKLTHYGKKVCIIENGASTPRGALGYVKGVCELYSQCIDNRLDIKNICIPAGNGGLAAGVIFGTALLEMPFHIELITVEHELDEIEGIILTLLKSLEELTGVKPTINYKEIFTIHEEFRFGGWGITSPEIDGFIRSFAQSEGILVEKVYTAKVLLGMIELVKTGVIGAGSCYIHSGGIGALFSQLGEHIH